MCFRILNNIDMINVIIIDDDRGNIKYLQGLLKEYYPSVNVAASSCNLKDALSQIEKHNPEIVFLDVELEGEMGFDLFKTLTHPDFEVIFTTAHEKYALQAIKSSCLEYLLKPIDYRELIKALDKYVEYKKSVVNQKKLDVLLENMASTKSAIAKMAIPVSDGYQFLDVSEIVYCEADGNYTKVFTKQEGNFLSTKTLKEFEETLDGQQFFRCHKSWVINLNFIKKYSRSEGNRVQMINDKWIDISVRKREEFLKLFEK